MVLYPATTPRDQWRHPNRESPVVITVSQLEVRAGARLLMDDVSFRIAAGDRIGLVGRNGAGKTTLTRILAGEALPAGGTVHVVGLGRLPARRTRAPATSRCSRATGSCRREGSTTSYAGCGTPRREMGSDDPDVRDRAMRRYEKADAALHAAGGYSAEAEAAQIAASLGIEDRLLGQPLRTLSGGQRRRVELARILFSGAETLLLDEPTNHLDADSIVWLREFLRNHKGGLVVISHDVGLLEACVNRVLHLDANRAVIDIYNIGWKAYLAQRETDEKRRKRERMNAENKAKTLTDQANKMRAKATKAQAAQSMLKRAERLLEGVEGEREGRPGGADQVPLAGALRQDAAHRQRAVQVLRVARGVHRRRPRRRQGQPRGHPRAQRRRQDHAAAHPRRRRPPDTGTVEPGHGLKIGYYAQEHETLDTSRTVLQNLHSAAPQLTDTEARSVLGSFLFSGDDANKPAARALRWGEDPAGPGDPGGLERQRAAARRAHQQPRPGLPRGGAGRDSRVRRRDRAGDPRRGRRTRARARPRADPARRRRGPLDAGLRRPRRAGLTPRPRSSLRRMSLPDATRSLTPGLPLELDGAVLTVTLDKPDTAQQPDPADVARARRRSARRCPTRCASSWSRARATASRPASTPGCSSRRGSRARSPSPS